MINILFPFSKKSLGGGNNFLLNLRSELINRKLYSGFWVSRVVLINSHHFGKSNIFLLLLFVKRIIARKFIVIHRIDGSLVVGRGAAENTKIDKKIMLVNRFFADRTILQSKWAMDVFKSLYPNRSWQNPEVLYNFSRFNFEDTVCNAIGDVKKINLLYCSWSTNELKGFETLVYLDKYLDFNYFNLTYVGRIPKGLFFKNIHTKGVLNGEELKFEYSDSDIFLALMLNDACSNALIEAQAAGLLVMFFDSGGNKEVIHDRSVRVRNKEEILDFLRKVQRIGMRIDKFPFQRVNVEEYIANLLK